MHVGKSRRRYRDLRLRQRHGERAHQAFAEYGVGKREIYDLRQDLKDPRQTESRVKFQVDGTHEWTQRAVYSQSQFPAVLQSCIFQVESLPGEKQPIIVVRGCRTGYHRADTVGRTERECLNRMEKIGPNGRRIRMFNSPLCDVWAKDVQRHLMLAVDWARSPFTLAKGGSTFLRESLYAFESCSTRGQAAENFTRLYDWVDSLFESRGPDGGLGGGEAPRPCQSSDPRIGGAKVQPQQQHDAEKRPAQVKASPYTSR
ncbi:hypothetical protein N9L68_09230 [bacterium]|nr:hypothetical protein [bacterium]